MGGNACSLPLIFVQHCKEPITKIETNIIPSKGISTFMCLVSDLYFPTIDMPILLQEICGSGLGIYMYIAHRHMNVEIGTESEQFPKKEYINGIFVAVHGLPVSHKIIQK